MSPTWRRERPACGDEHRTASARRGRSGVSERLILLEMPLIEISSTVLRARVRAGQTIHHQVPRAVEAYIKKNGLYLSNSR